MNRYGWGFLLIVLGLMGLGQVTGQFNFGLSFWPVFMAVLGGWLAWKSVVRGRSYFMTGLGLWVAGIGLFGILYNAGVTSITAGDIARLGWPLLLVGMGISFLFGRRGYCCWGEWPRGRDWHGVGDRHHGRERWTLDEDLNLSHGIGDVVLDLTTADITEGVHHITVGAVIGDVLIRVPEDVNVQVDASLSIGELEVLGERRSGLGGLSVRKQVVAADSKVDLRIKARLSIGDLTVVEVPAPRRITL
ncbi:MAG: cell wall-active antibiotics response protein LiaF [Actinobacteria bacterium]|nr:cell wall-active antibiotics response protein LiaF [Actinomycetota bacterium]